MDDFLQRLHTAETDFVTALANSPQMLVSCSQTWSTLLQDLSTASVTGKICSETLSLAHLVASRVSNIASCYLDIKREEEKISARLRVDCDALLHQMNGLNLDADARSKSLHPTGFCGKVRASPTALSVGSLSPPFVAGAHKWLLDNLYNPYPSAEVKAKIAATSSCQISSVSTWFVNVRRRIGWTALCQERFSKRRADMLDAAYRALVEDPHHTLSAELRHSFIAMRVIAEGLYSSGSAFAGDLDAMAKNWSDGHKESFEAARCCQAEATLHSYPSPDRSIMASPVPTLDSSLTDESGGEEVVAPPPVSGLKRRRLSVGPANQSAASRPVKRLRTSMTSQMQLPSPPSSTVGNESPSDESSPGLSSTGPESIPPPGKMHPSDTDAIEKPSSPGNSVTAPRLHLMSDPFPSFNMENSIDDWFNSNFDALFAIPPPVDATEPDYSAPWEVEMFRDYRIPENSGYSLKHPSAPADSHVFGVTDTSEFDHLLQSIGTSTFARSSGSVSPLNTTGPSYPAPLDLSMPDMSYINCTALLDGSDSYQSIIDSISSEYPTHSQSLPENDLSMLRLPPVIHAVQAHDLALKQAKLDQLHAMQEAVRRMEQELQSEGIIR